MTEPDAERLRFAWLIAAIFVLFTVPRLFLHELWRDEAWLWLVVTESHSVHDLCSSLGRSGQGYLFPILCVIARQVSASPRAMQFVNLILAGAGAFAFARWAPFRRRERALFVFGYFLFYEYAVISRHYAAGALLTWLACAAARSGRRLLVFACVLGLLCQTTVYGLILAIAIVGGWMLDRWLRRDELAALPRAEIVVSIAVALAGFVAGVAQITPLPGTSFAPEWHFGWEPERAGMVLSMVWRAFVPLPRPWIQFWNTNLLDAWPALQVAGGLLMLALAAAVLWRQKAALLTFCIGVAGILGFGYIKYIGVMRHGGHLWILFAAALWLGGFQDSRRSWRARTLMILLTIHCVAGAFASWVDLRHPFSNGAAAAELIRKEGLDHYPLLGHREPPAASVALPLGLPMYSPSRGIFVTHPDYGPLQREMSDEELRCAARALARREGRDIVLVINRELPPWEELTPAGATSGAIAPTEDFHLYLLRFSRLGATAAAAQCRSDYGANASTRSRAVTVATRR